MHVARSMKKNSTASVENWNVRRWDWGGYRPGFEGSTTLILAGYNIDYDLGPAAREVELFLSVEGIRQ
jgi:hypothetical protein